jgi:hypothetical protein
MTATKTKAAQGLAPEAALETTLRKPNPNAWKCTAQASPECLKWAAVSAYCWGVLSREGCSRLFRQHPDWVSA